MMNCIEALNFLKGGLTSRCDRCGCLQEESQGLAHVGGFGGIQCVYEFNRTDRQRGFVYTPTTHTSVGAFMWCAAIYKDL